MKWQWIVIHISMNIYNNDNIKEERHTEKAELLLAVERGSNKIFWKESIDTT